MKNCVIYDFETLSQDQYRGVVVSFAMLTFDEDRFISGNKYTYQELLDKCSYIKFDTIEQIEVYKRKPSESTLQWWSEQGEKARQQLKPSPSDKSISDLYDWIISNLGFDASKLVKSYTRGNTFDPIFLQNIMKQIQKPEPFHWKTIRDTRSMIEGLTFGMNIDNGFMIKEYEDVFVKHDPRHDIVMDVMRMQYIVSNIFSNTIHS